MFLLLRGSQISKIQLLTACVCLVTEIVQDFRQVSCFLEVVRPVTMLALTQQRDLAATVGNL